MLSEGTLAPHFSLLSQNDEKISLENFLGKYVVLYFYPKDDTPGCTKEACSMRDNYELLSSRVTILGVSADSVESHKKFADKYNLPFLLLSDPKKEVITLYEANGVFTKRVTYLINPEGVIEKTYPTINPTEHAEEILQDLRLQE